MMDVKRGYKQTEVGDIPDDWEVLPITSVLQKGSRITYGVVKPGVNPDDGVLFIRGGDILDGMILTEQLRRISHEVSHQYKRTRLSGGEILISLVGYPGEVARVPAWLAGANIARQVALVRLESAQPVFGEFVCRFLRSNRGRQLLLKESIGSAQQVINLRDIARVVLVLPPEVEQRAIATALSDVDELLAALDRLIAKKRDLKQAAMQQLVTGQTRLPGFHGQWEVKSFSDVLSRINARAHQIRVSDYRASGRYPVVDQGKKPVVGFSDRQDKLLRCSKGGVIVFGDHTCIVKFIDFDFLVGADGTQILQAKQGHSTVFHAQALQHRGVEHTGYNRHFKFLTEREFASPPHAEQTAIAEVLSDMDAELEALEQRREKTRGLKQGMMQELLTGRTRLV